MDEYNKTSKYKILCKIGEGVHGIVLKAIDLTNNKIVAIKKVPLKTKYGEISINTIREIKVLQHCDCEYILSLYDIFPNLTGLALVVEYIPYTLYSKLKDENNPLSRSIVKRYTKQLLQGIKYMHNLGIMHRDIKPANLLINDNDVLKIADFGLSRLYDSDDHSKLYSPQVASRWYRAPELLWGSPHYGPPVDMWAIGCVFAEMLRGIPLFGGMTDIEQLALVIKILGTPNSKDWPELNTLPDYQKIRFPNAKGENWENILPTCTSMEEIGLVDGLVKYNPHKRFTAIDALNCEYFE